MREVVVLDAVWGAGRGGSLVWGLDLESETCLWDGAECFDESFWGWENDESGVVRREGGGEEGRRGGGEERRLDGIILLGLQIGCRLIRKVYGWPRSKEIHT